MVKSREHCQRYTKLPNTNNKDLDSPIALSCPAPMSFNSVAVACSLYKAQ